MARQVLEIFLSSTSEDMKAYRSTVSEVLSRMGQFVVRMETFGAKPSKPVATCRQEVMRSDALVVLVGHRHGWTPSAADGGDGERSITWLEVQWALDAGKPVYAFMVDPAAPWTGAREQDRLVAATTDAEGIEVCRAVRQLQAFRRFLDGRVTRELFRNADHLGGLVATSLFQWLLEHAAPVRPSDPLDHQPAASLPADAPLQRQGTVRGPIPGQRYWLEQTHSLSARELVGAAPPVRVAILAGRPRTTHPALQGVPITLVDAGPGAASQEGDDYTTAIASVIASRGGGGFEGIAPGVELLAIRVLSSESTSDLSVIARGIDRAVLGGARVICLTLGLHQASLVLEEAVQEAVNAGVTVVAAAGNDDGDSPVYPAALDCAVAAGAVDAEGRAAPWSNFGPWVDVAAPGCELVLAAGEDGSFVTSGTTWACAITSGVAALVCLANPRATPAQIKALLVDTARPALAGDAKALRLVNAFAAVRAAATLGA